MCLYMLIRKLWPTSNIASSKQLEQHLNGSRLAKHEISFAIESIQKINSTGVGGRNIFPLKRKL